MDKKYYEIVFVVLVYKNIAVLKDFLKTLKLSFTYKVIVVNSFYDSSTEEECRAVSILYNADYIPVPNLGYSSGNNVGCNYAINNYQYKFLIVANSDVIIHDLTFLNRFEASKAVIAPDTKMINGKRQNPNIPFKSRIYLKSIDKYYRTQVNFFFYIGLVFNRLYRELVVFITKILNLHLFKIFSPHGSFIIFTYEASVDLVPIFNDKMFLYNEELYLAYNCILHKVPVFYSKEIKVTHLEGASSNSKSNSWKNHKASYDALIKWKKEVGLL